MLTIVTGQGGRLKGLGTDKNTETWTTKWDKISKLPQDWCGPKPSCKNDGHQFISSGSKGPFSLAANPKKIRDIGTYSEDGDSAWVESREVPEGIVIPEEVEDADIEAREVDEDDESALEAQGEAEAEADIHARDTGDNVVGVAFEA